MKIIQNDKNYGFAKGYTIALKNIDADVFALVNSGILVTKNWLEPIIKAFQTEKKTVIIQTKTIDCKDKSKFEFEYAGVSSGFIDKFGYPFYRLSQIKKFENKKRDCFLGNLFFNIKF